MAEEVQGQAEVPAAPLQQNMNPHQAQNYLEAALNKASEPVRNDKGQFVAKETPAEATPETEAPKEEASEAAPASTEEPETPVSETKRFKLKYKGEELEKDEEEVISLAQQGFDYTQKSQALAKEREEMSAKIRAETEAAQKRYEQSLEAHRKALEKIAGIEDTDLNKLALEDPTRAQQEFFKRLQYQQTLNAIQAEQQQIAQSRGEEFRNAAKKQAEEAIEILQTKIPGWGNDLYGKVLKQAVKEYGFKQQEVNAITDHRAIEVLHDAMKWRELKAAKPQTVDKKVAAVPKVQKPGTGEKPDPKKQALSEKYDRLKKTGSKADGEALILQWLDQGAQGSLRDK